MRELNERIRRREARCGVIGLGYVGLPLALEFARAGFHVTGIDVDGAKIDAINGGRSYVVDLEDGRIVSSGRVRLLCLEPGSELAGETVGTTGR